MVYSDTNPDDATDGEIAAMTAENCDTEHWESDEDIDRPESFFGKIRAWFVSLFTWFKKMFSLIFNKAG